MRFELTKEYIEQLKVAIHSNDVAWIDEHVIGHHFADIAEILDKLNSEQAKVVYYRLDEDLQADVLMELEEEVRDRFLKSLSSKEIAEQLENLDSDDAADILGELTDKEITELNRLIEPSSKTEEASLPSNKGKFTGKRNYGERNR
jgi:magnesium transporter